MRAMNGRLGNLVRSPLVRNKYLNNGEAKMHRRHSSAGEEMPRAVQFDESSDQYRCLCGCFHVKTGTYLIASSELLLILVFFLNSLLVLIQQQDDLVDPGGKHNPWGSHFVRIAFTIESVSLAVALGSVLLLLVGLGLNSAPLLVPHLIVQSISLLCLFLALIVATIALITDLSSFYRLLNVVPFNEFPGQTTVAFSAETSARVYTFVGLYFGTFLFECWSIRIIYNCNRYFYERRRYMQYCLAYSTPLKTLYSAR
ncbi:hypothetical protein niasHS_000730 [Heterodera schachtii]|uniref:Uncharacterized protein n=1 Tax=Heterodera schachtii TaxID=97005 RepID=A0ABD2KC91_HETSC